MSRNEPDKSESEDLQSIPKEQQEISTKEITEADYDVVPSEYRDGEDGGGQQMSVYHGRMTPPGRTFYDDSIDASSEDRDRTDEGYLFSAGYESSMATRIGNEEISDPRLERPVGDEWMRCPASGEHLERRNIERATWLFGTVRHRSGSSPTVAARLRSLDGPLYQRDVASDRSPRREVVPPFMKFVVVARGVLADDDGVRGLY